MKKNLLMLVILILQSILFSQSFDNFSNSPYNNSPENISKSKAFQREREFYETRTYPEGFIPEGAYQKAFNQKLELSKNKSENYGGIQWSSIGPTSGGYFSWGSISSRIVTGAYNPKNPDIIYIGPANGGVWKSTNGGVMWTPLTDNQPSMSMGAIALDPVNPEIIYAGTGEATYSGVSYYGNGLLRSTDGGATWKHITAGLPSRNYFSRIVVRPGNSDYLLAAMGTSGLYKSTNAGLNWSIVQSGRCDDVIYVSSDTAFIVGSGSGFKRSTDGGITFQTFGAGLPSGTRTHFDFSKTSPKTMYAAVYSGSNILIYKSVDAGESFIQVAATVNFNGSQGWYDLYLRVHPQNPDIVFVGSIDIWKSTDGGNTFSNITNTYENGNVHADQHNMFFHPQNPDILIACNDGGIYKSTNAGTSFVNLNQNLTLTQFYRITASPFNPSFIMGGTQDNGTQKTTGSITWNAAFGGDGGEVCFSNKSQNFIIGESQNGGLVRTINGGTSWSSATSGLNTSESVSWVAPILKHPTNADEFYVARQKLYKSTNNGASWVAVSGDINSTTAVKEMAISYSDPTIFYVSSSSKIFRSIDTGKTFTNLTVGLPNKTISSISIHPNNSNIVLLTYSGFGTSKVYKTTNGGTSWFSIFGNLPDSPVNDLFIYTEDTLHPETYFVATDLGVFVTQNNGTDWQELGNGLPNTVIMHLDYAPSTHKLRAGTHGRGVYEAFINYHLPTDINSSFNQKNIVPVKAEIYANFPNPFNPVTVITYVIPVKGNVEIQIYNTLGQLIATPVSSYMSPGVYDYTWNASGLSSGNYIVNLIHSDADGKVTQSSRKITLVK